MKYCTNPEIDFIVEDFLEDGGEEGIRLLIMVKLQTKSEKSEKNTSSILGV